MRISDWSSDVCSSDLHYRVQQTRAPETIARAERPAPPQVAGNVRIAGLNLLNLFNGDGNGGGFPTARGARDVAGYRSAERRVGKACDSTCRSRWSPVHIQNTPS